MNPRIIETEECDGNCAVCSKEAELRPYGRGGEWICFECGMADLPTTCEQCDKNDFNIIK